MCTGRPNPDAVSLDAGLHAKLDGLAMVVRNTDPDAAKVVVRGHAALSDADLAAISAVLDRQAAGGGAAAGTTRAMVRSVGWPGALPVLLPPLLLLSLLPPALAASCTGCQALPLQAAACPAAGTASLVRHNGLIVAWSLPGCDGHAVL